MLKGMAWGSLKEETKEFLLSRANVWDSAKNGECIIDLTEDLSVAGTVIDGELNIDDNAIIYNPSEGVVLVDEKREFYIDNVMTVTEAAKEWGLTEGAIRDSIKRNKFIPGVDYRKAGRITLITREAMERVYGEKED